MTDALPASLLRPTPSFHDGRLIGLFLRRRDELLLFLSEESGIEWTLVASQLSRLVANDFREGNIILDISIGSADSLGEDELHELYQLRSETQIATFGEKLRQGLLQAGSVIVVVSASYGCTLSAVCGSVSLHPGIVLPPTDAGGATDTKAGPETGL